MATDLNDLKNNVVRVADRVRRREPGLLLLAGKRLEGLMKARIFNKGGAVTGKIGKYKSKSWIKTRSKKGNQVAFVDLQFTGDLLRSFKTVRDGDEVVLAIVNDEDFLKATGNEKRRKKKIFEPTTEEFDRVNEYFEDLISDATIEEFLKI